MGKKLSERVNKIRTRREPEKIEKVESMLSKKGLAARRFLGSFIVDRRVQKEGFPFYNRVDGKNVESILLEEYGRVYECPEWKEIKIKLLGAAGQLVTQRYTLTYPHLEGQEINQFFRDVIMSKWAVKNKLIDDENLTILRAIMSAFDITYDDEKGICGLRPREKGRAVDESHDVLAVLNREVELGYVNKQIGDHNHSYAYTHILRRNLQLKLQGWQKYLLMNWKQFNYVAGSRRIGKTYTSGYIAKRELYRKGGGYGARERQIIFVCVSEEKMWQPLQYLLTMCKDDIALGYIKYTQKDKQFENTITGAKLIFRSAGSRTGAASYGADLVILDEAAMIGDQFWEDLLPIIIQEGASVFAISTINEDVKDNWFYRELINAELGLNDAAFALRVTIDDNELLSEERKNDMKEALKHNPMKYWTQLYSIFPSGNSVFSLTGVIQPDLEIPPTKVVIGYDPGKVKDNASVVIVDMEELRVIEEITWNQVTYKNQSEYMIDIKKRYPNSTVIMDRTGVGEGVAEIFGDLVDVYVKYKGMGETTFNQTFGYYQVSKMTLVENTKLYFENFGLKVNSSLQNLISELKGFQKIQNGTRVVQYSGVGVKDDSVNALMLACFYLKHIAGIQGKHQITQSEVFDNTVGKDGYINGLFIYDDYNENVYKKFNY